MKKDSNKEDEKRTKAEIDVLLRRVDALPLLDSRHEDQILGYDEDGTP
jgi:hypothetical protein